MLSMPLCCSWYCTGHAIVMFMVFGCSCHCAVHANVLFMILYCSCYCAVHVIVLFIRVITKLPNSEQSYKSKVKTHNFINRQNQSTTEKLWKPQWPCLGTVHDIVLFMPLYCSCYCTVHSIVLFMPLCCSWYCTVHAIILFMPLYCSC